MKMHRKHSLAALAVAAAAILAGRAQAVSETSARTSVVEIPGAAVMGALPALNGLTGLDAARSFAAIRAADLQMSGLRALESQPAPLASLPTLQPVLAAPALKNLPAASSMGRLRNGETEIRKAVTAGDLDRADDNLKRFFGEADGNKPVDNGTGDGNGTAGGSNGNDGGKKKAGEWLTQFTDPRTFLEAARTAAGGETAELIGVYTGIARENNQPAHAWVYAFRDKVSLKYMTVTVSASGRIVHVGEDRMQQVAEPIDLKALLPLPQVLENVRALGHSPSDIKIARKSSTSPVVYTFSLLASSVKIDVNAATGEIIPIQKDKPREPGPGAIGTPEQIAELNKAVAELLKPYNDNLTKASLAFLRVGTNDKRAVELEVTASVDKKGATADGAIRINQLSYSYPESPDARPETKAKLALELPLLKLATQEQINDLAPNADRLLKEFTEQKRREYGAAATVDARITHLDKDAAGNVTGLGLAIDLDMDLSKLPPKKDQKYVYATRVRIALEMTLQGLTLAIEVVHNPNANEFQKDKTGLKELLDGFLAHDAKALKTVTTFIDDLDSLTDTFLGNKHRRRPRPN